MKLGFEHLGVRKRIVGYSNEALMDAYITMEGACVEAQEIYYSLTDSIATVDHLIQIRDVVERIGYTETINHLYGNNNITFTTEGLGDTLKKGWEAIVKWFKELWTKIKNFFKRLFGLTDKTIRAIEDEVKQAKKAFASNSKLNTNITVAESFTSSNIQKLSNEFDQNIASKTTIEKLCSMDDEEASQIKEAATDLATKLRGMSSNERVTKKPLDKTFVDKAVDMANLLQDICKKGERIVDRLHTAPDKLKASAEKADDVQQLKAAQNAIKQAGIILNAIDDCAKQAANSVLYIKTKLEAFNNKAPGSKVDDEIFNDKELGETIIKGLKECKISRVKTGILYHLDQDKNRNPMLAVKVADKVNRFVKAHLEEFDIDDPDTDGLYDKDNHLTSTPPKDEWDIKFLIKLKASLQTNFSREKLVLAQEVIAHLKKKGGDAFNPDADTNKKTEDKQPPKPEPKSDNDNESFADSYLRKALNELDISSAKAAVIGLLDEDNHNDPMVALKEADKANQVFKEHGKTFYVSDNGRPERLPKEEWSSNYIIKLKAALRLNFSREKIALIQEVIRYLRSKGEDRFQVK